MNAQAIQLEVPRAMPAGWHASLALQIEQRSNRSILASSRHQGPLRIQRAFYPESDGTCHLYVLHPPGGVVQGDVLDTQLDVAAESRCLVTTPGATKFYRSEGKTSYVCSRIRVAARGRCEWLPQESIVFNGARVEIDTEIQLEAGATFVGWEITCLGRPAAAEDFTSGQYLSRLRVAREDKPLLRECLRIAGGDSLLRMAWGLRGCPACGTLVLATPDADWVEWVREALPEESSQDVMWAGTELEGISVFRALGNSANHVRRVLGTVWDCCRRRIGTDGHHWPRIWAV